MKKIQFIYMNCIQYDSEYSNIGELCQYTLITGDKLMFYIIIY